MVKKLIKYELKYYFRILLVVLPIMLMIGASVRFLQFFESEKSIYQIIFGSTLMMLVVATYIALLFSLVLAVIRFYKNMYSTEGYLTFTLPVSVHQHMAAKLIGYAICQLASIIIVILAWTIAYLGVFDNLWVNVGKIVKALFAILNGGHLVLYVIEIILLLLIGLFSSPLIYYSCISIGQLAKKNRILLAIGVYYLYTVIVQILMTILMVVFSFAISLGAFEGIGRFISNHPYAFIHILLCSSIVFSIGISALFYFINCRMMTRKLNLE